MKSMALILTCAMVVGVVGCDREPAPADARLGTFLQWTYEDASGRERWIYLLQPSDTARAIDGRVPIVVLYHGGGWVGGTPVELMDYARLLAGRGYAVALPEYRVDDEVDAPAEVAVANGRRAMTSIRDHATDYDLDLTRLVLGGGSAGGHVAFMTARQLVTDRHPVAGLILMSAVTDTTAAGYGVEKCGSDPIQLSPAHIADASTPPTLIVHSEADTVTPFTGAELLDQRLTGLGVEVTMVRLADESHGLYVRAALRQPRPAWVTTMLSFLERVTSSPQ